MSLIPATTLNNSKKTKTEDNISPLAADKDIYVLLKDSQSKNTYEKFNNDLSIYLSKIKNQSSNVCSLLLNKDALYLGVLGKSNNSVLGCNILNGDKLSAVVLCANVLDIDFKTGEINDPENINYIIYFQFIRATTRIFISEIERDQTLNNLLIEYYNYLLMKSLKLPMLNDKQIELLKFIVGVMYYKYFYKYNDALAIEKCETLLSKEYYSEFKSTIKNSNISKYSDIKDIIKLISEFKISFDPPNQMLYSLLVNIKTMGVLLITSDIHHLIATAILSQYPCNYYQPLFINRQSQSRIENIITAYFPKIEFSSLKSNSIKPSTE